MTLKLLQYCLKIKMHLMRTISFIDHKMSQNRTIGLELVVLEINGLEMY